MARISPYRAHDASVTDGAVKLQIPKEAYVTTGSEERTAVALEAHRAAVRERQREIAQLPIPEMGTVIAAAVVRVGGTVRPLTRAGEGWPRLRAGVTVQLVSQRSVPGARSIA